MQEQVDGLSVFDLHFFHTLAQLKQGGGGQLWNDVQLKRDKSNKRNAFMMLVMTSVGPKGWQCPENVL